MIEILLIAVLAAGALVYVTRPVLQSGEDRTLEEPVLVDEAVQRKRAALRAIVDVEEEHEIGKLSREEFESLRSAYEAEAAGAMTELDALSGAPEDDALEAEIAEMRERMTCPKCGALRSPGEECPSCSFAP
jgi:hypothetical protein